MKVLWLADELGLQYEQQDVGGPFGGNDTAEFRALNPNGLVPVIEDDGFRLWESNAIVRYLAARYGYGTLCPADPLVRARADQWMEWLSSTAGPLMTPIFWGLVRTPPAERDNAGIERAIRRGYDIWAILDAALAQTPFVAGPHFSMGDVPFGPHVHRWMQLVPDRPRMPHLEDWYRRMTERPAYRWRCMIPIV